MKKDNDSVTNNTVVEYLGNFKSLLDACGQIACYANKRRFLKVGVNNRRFTVSSNRSCRDYYGEKRDEWHKKAEEAYDDFCVNAGELGYEVPDKEKYLDGMLSSKERRDAYKCYLNTCIKNNKALSPEEMEKKFQHRMQRHLSDRY